MAESSTMKALVIREPYKVEVVDVPMPVAQAGEAIVKVELAGLCGSDLHIYRGHQPTTYDFTLGHEFTGKIHSVGLGIKNFKVGDPVVSPFTISCGECFYCLRGHTSRCVQSKVFGCVALEGAQAQYVRVPLADTTLYPAPEGIPPATLVLMADILPTGYSVVDNACKMLEDEERKSSTCVVIGCGPVGLCAVTAAKARFDVVYAIDSIPERLAAAERHGAIKLHLKDDDPVATIKAATGGRGADVVCEVVGVEAALLMAIDVARPWGVISCCGIHTHGINLKGLDLYNKNLRFQFGRCSVRQVFKPALELLSQNTELFSSFVAHRVPLSSAPEYYKLFEQNRIMKTVFDMDM